MSCAWRRSKHGAAVPSASVARSRPAQAILSRCANSSSRAWKKSAARSPRHWAGGSCHRRARIGCWLDSPPGGAFQRPRSAAFVLLRSIAAFRRFRRASLRFEIENQRIEGWLEQIAEIAPRNHELAVELAECQTLVKGYGDTHERGWSSFSQISSLLPNLVGDPNGRGTASRPARGRIGRRHGYATGTGHLVAARPRIGRRLSPTGPFRLRSQLPAQRVVASSAH